MIQIGGRQKSSSSFFTLLCLLCFLVWITIIKILLIPSYKSTDFDVHRNWLAITRHLPIGEWYYDNVNGTTVHTLDYPPSFAYFEYILSNNHLTTYLLKHNLFLDERCLQLLPDNDNTPSMNCIIFHRFTVIISDIILWIGAYLASMSMFYSSSSSLSSSSSKQQQNQKEDDDDTMMNSSRNKTFVTFLLIILNPGLLLLDHVHFQYNGMLLGILLISIGFLLKASSPFSKQQQQQSIIRYHLYNLSSAFFYALLLTMKHLYLPLGPLYFIYLLKSYCFYYKYEESNTTTTTRITKFSFTRFVLLGFVTLSTLIIPFIPFIYPINHMKQLLSRLFPFGRGLVHDYWAGNIWALYVTADKVIGFVSRKIPLLQSFLPENFHLPTIQPITSALCLLIGLIPSLICSWQKVQPDSTTTTIRENNNNNNSNSNSNTVTKDKNTTTVSPTSNNSNNNELLLIYCIVYCSFSAFMLAYHVHEKAIMTVIIPMTLLACTSIQNARLFIRTCYIGIFGLFPLLYRPVELPIKFTSYILYLSFSVYVLETIHNNSNNNENNNKKKENILTLIDKVGLTILSIIFIFMEIIHPLYFQPYGILEFLPLMMTSIVCAVGLIGCWIQSCMLMFSC